MAPWCLSLVVYVVHVFVWDALLIVCNVLSCVPFINNCFVILCVCPEGTGHDFCRIQIKSHHRQNTIYADSADWLGLYGRIYMYIEVYDKCTLIRNQDQPFLVCVCVHDSSTSY